MEGRHSEMIGGAGISPKGLHKQRCGVWLKRSEGEEKSKSETTENTPIPNYQGGVLCFFFLFKVNVESIKCLYEL